MKILSGVDRSVVASFAERCAQPRAQNLFARVELEVVRAAIAAGVLINVDEGEIVPTTMSGSPILLILIDGALLVSPTRSNTSDVDKIVIGEAGDCVGDLALILGEPARDLVRALRASTVLAIQRTQLWSLIDASPEFSKICYLDLL